MTDINVVLDKFSKSAEQLNKVSDSLTETLRDIEKRLRETNVGLEWRMPLFTEDAGLDEMRDRWGEVYARYTLTDETILSFEKFNDAWRLIISVERIRNRHPSESVDQEFVDKDEASRIPLDSASRKIRIEAIKQMPRFLEGFSKQVDEGIANIASAEKSLK